MYCSLVSDLPWTLTECDGCMLPGRNFFVQPVSLACSAGVFMGNVWPDIAGWDNGVSLGRKVWVEDLCDTLEVVTEKKMRLW